MDPRPCVTMADLWAWQPPGGPPREEVDEGKGDDARLPPHPSGVPEIEELREVHVRRKQPQLLVCHDYKGDFPACDRWEGCDAKECAPFLITHWLHMDTFCYFGHKLVTIPPPAYTSIAHTHGVAVIGTLIFEHDEGYNNLCEILATEANRRRAVRQLVAIMATWRFDGWLVNVEVGLGVRQVSMLINFLELLKRATRDENPSARVLWYDAVCTDGLLLWQNKLCPANRDFYNACDGIFINYGWKPADLETSRYNEGAATVCVGIDVYGRSGGSAGWETHEAMTKIHRKCLSVALFAPGWAVEAEENALGDPQENSMRFWWSLSHVVNTRPLARFPFRTTFRNGYSQGGKFFRMRDMDLMPALALSKKALLPTEHGLVIKQRGKHVLWTVMGMRSNRDFRVKIRVEGPGSVTIKLDQREMQLARIDEDGSMELHPLNGECLPIKAIFVVVSEPDTVLTYFEAYSVETAKCLD